MSSLPRTSNDANSSELGGSTCANAKAIRCIRCRVTPNRSTNKLGQALTTRAKVVPPSRTE